MGGLDDILARRGRPPDEPDLVIRQTTSRESDAALGVLHEARCRRCGRAVGPDTLEAVLRIAGKHMKSEHGISLDQSQWIDVRLGEERWEGTKHG